MKPHQGCVAHGWHPYQTRHRGGRAVHNPSLVKEDFIRCSLVFVNETALASALEGQSVRHCRFNWRQSKSCGPNKAIVGIRSRRAATGSEGPSYPLDSPSKSPGIGFALSWPGLLMTKQTVEESGVPLRSIHAACWVQFKIRHMAITSMREQFRVPGGRLRTIQLSEFASLHGVVRTPVSPLSACGWPPRTRPPDMQRMLNWVHRASALRYPYALRPSSLYLFRVRESAVVLIRGY